MIFLDFTKESRSLMLNKFLKYFQQQGKVTTVFENIHNF